tara:strand:+ start:867 stop:1220 length:354 start_codon:yes stop_codon:yes gene_type:complete
MNRNKISYIFSLLFTVLFPLEAFASCDNSPDNGLFIKKDENKKSLISTFQINFESEDQIYKALRMAENKARFALANAYKKLNKIETASVIVPGMMKTGECYDEKGSFVKVTLETSLD